MIYHLFDWLNDYFRFSGSGVFEYITVRAAFAFISALLVALIFGKWYIKMRMKRIEQAKEILEEQRNLSGSAESDMELWEIDDKRRKRETPSMGGIIILIAILTGAVLFCDLTNVYIILLIIATVWLGTLGYLDDGIKSGLLTRNHKPNKEGLAGKYKIFGQASLGLLIGLTLYFSPQAKIVKNIGHEVNNEIRTEKVVYSSNAVKSTQTTIPFLKNHNLDYASAFSWAGDWQQPLGWVLFIIVSIFVMMAMSNGSNLTDGLDGLAAGTCAIQGATLGILAYLSGNIRYSGYLDIMYIPGSGEITVFAMAFLGALMGFLWFNAYPAQIFMGDTGSLTLGGMLAIMALAIHKELLLPILAGIFLMESLSVIIQTAFFKITARKSNFTVTGANGQKRRIGDRIFKQTPLHHHFQYDTGHFESINMKNYGNTGKYLLRWPEKRLRENTITTRFWIIGLILAALTIITLKIR